MLCQSCYDADQALPMPTWKAYFGGPVLPAFICAVLPFFVRFDVNGVYYSALVGGGLGLLLGLVAMARAGAGPGGKRRVGAGIVLLLSATQIYLSNLWLL